jgi:hypothetical protein
MYTAADRALGIVEGRPVQEAREPPYQLEKFRPLFRGNVELGDQPQGGDRDRPVSQQGGQ